MGNLTIIYYSSNSEDSKFENKIIEDLKKKAGDIPIVSVTMKPLDLGTNICIGGQPVCYSNLWKQQLIGLKAAKTKFCITAEADCLYPESYFKFTPPREDMVYMYDNIWAFWKNRDKFWRKPSCEGAQMCGREYWIERLESMLEGHEGWEPMPNPSHLVGKIFYEKGKWSGDPVITFLTGDGISTKTSLSKEPSLTELPYWGEALKIKKNIFDE